MANELIIYRNPLEEKLWDGLLNMGGDGTIIFPIIFIVIGIWLTTLALNQLGKRFKWVPTYDRRRNVFIFLISIGGIFVGKLVKFVFVFVIPYTFGLLGQFLTNF